MADCVMGICGKDFVIIASDKTVSRSILKIQDNDDKLTNLSSNQILGTCGEVSERKSFSNLVKGEGEYYYYRYNNRLNTQELANYTRNMLAEALRKGPKQVNCLIAGVDNEEASLYWLDYLGTLQKVSRGAQGYASYFVLSIMDNFYKKDLDLQDAQNCIKACIKELKVRFVIDMTNFSVRLINKNGITDISSQFA